MATLGRLTASQLAPLVGTTMRASVATARMYTRLRREAFRAKRRIDVAEPGGAYRSTEDLIDIQRQWLGKSHKRNWFLNPGSGAMPSLYSVHGLGRCLDFTGDVGWVKQVSGDWGLTFPLVHLGDLNHGQHDGVTRGQQALYPYEVKRIAKLIERRTGLDVGAANTGKRGMRGATNYWKGLRIMVERDHLKGKSQAWLEQHYLDKEAGLA